MRAGWSAALLLPLLAGCAPGNCDPNTAGFFSGIGCEASGSYAARNAGLQNNLAAARYNLQQERVGADAAAIDARVAGAERDRAAGRLAEMGRQNRALRARFDAAAQRAGTDRSQIAAQRAELDQIERERAGMAQRGSSAGEVEALERRRRALLDAANAP